MQKNPPLSITAQAGGLYVMNVKEDQAVKLSVEIKMICCRGVTEDGDQGRSVVEVILAELNSLKWE